MMNKQLEKLAKDLDAAGSALMEMGYYDRGNYVMDCAGVIKNAMEFYENNPVSPKQYPETKESLGEPVTWSDQLFEGYTHLRKRIEDQANKDFRTLREHILWCLTQTLEGTRTYGFPKKNLGGEYP